MEIKFNQVLGKEDVYYYNLFYFRRKSKSVYINYLIGIASVGLAIYEIVIKDYTTAVIWALLAIYSLVLQRYITRWQIRNAINRNKELDNPINVELSMDDEGVTYDLVDNNEQPKKMAWEAIGEVFDYMNYWYMFYTTTNAIIVRKSDCPNQNSVEEMLKEKFQNRYKKK